jgi:hypothetical protein
LRPYFYLIWHPVLAVNAKSFLLVVFFRVLFEFSDTILATKIDDFTVMHDGKLSFFIDLFPGYRAKGVAGRLHLLPCYNRLSCVLAMRFVVEVLMVHRSPSVGCQQPSSAYYAHHRQSQNHLFEHANPPFLSVSGTNGSLRKVYGVFDPPICAVVDRSTTQAIFVPY